MCDRPYNSTDKNTFSIISGLMFLILSSPFSFSLTNGVTSRFGLKISNSEGVPNLAGVLIHGFVFVVLVRLFMDGKRNDCTKPYNSNDKWIVALIGGLLFILLSSPFLYETINVFTSSFNFNTLDDNETPTIQGLILHSTIYALITRLLMR